MKKLHLYAIAAIAIVLLVYATCSITVNHLYPRTGIVTKIDHENDVITVTDYTGHQWEWTGIEDWQEGDIAAMIMNDMASETIFDDEIVKVYYNGWVE